MPKAVVLGSGRVGRVIARDLARESGFSVLLVDASEASLPAAAHDHSALQTRAADLRDARQLRSVVEGADVVAGALASAIGYDVLAQLVELSCAVVDISFFAQDARTLDARAKQTGARVVFDMGVAPGMSNALAAHAARELDACSSLDIVVGGVPRNPHPPFYYKAAFAPADVLEEYTRPARVVEAGAVVDKPALAEEEIVEFAGFGAYTAFLTDGLRSLATSLDVPSMREKTLRDPRHLLIMRALRDAGFFSKDEVALSDGSRITPIDATSALLFPHWRYDKGEADLTLLRVIATGERAGAQATIVWEMTDEYDAATDTTSMARTTAFPAAAVARMLAEGVIDGAGVHPPEALADAPGAFDRLLEEQREQGVVYSKQIG